MSWVCKDLCRFSGIESLNDVGWKGPWGPSYPSPTMGRNAFFDDIHPYVAIKAPLMGRLWIFWSPNALWGGWNNSVLSERLALMYWTSPFCEILSFSGGCTKLKWSLHPVHLAGWKGLGWFSHEMHQGIIQMLLNLTSLNTKVWQVSAKVGECGFWVLPWVEQLDCDI